MGHVSWSASAIVAGKPDDVYAWMTDFTADDHNSEAYKRGAARSRSEGADAPAGASRGVRETKKPQKPAVRKILSREANTLVIEDTWGGSTYKQTITLDPAARTVRIVSGFGYDSTWRATPEGAGATRVSVEGRMGKGIMGSIMKLFGSRMQRSMEDDFNGHMEELREWLAKK